MAAIKVGVLKFTGVYQYDLFDVTFEIQGINLTGKTLKCQVRAEAGSTVLLEFLESDNSLQKTINSTTQTTVRLFKTSAQMTIAPTENLDKPYVFTMVMYTAGANVIDIQTIIEGTIEILPQITRLP